MNTYGFEIEFTTHDNALLKYTHMEIAKMDVVADGAVLSGIPMKLETDSSDVLELVTPPFYFDSKYKVRLFRALLSRFIVSTVRTPITLDQWKGLHWGENLIAYIEIFWRCASGLDVDLTEELINEKYNECEQAREAQRVDGKGGEWTFEREGCTADSLRAESNINNIDDGINIAAATYLKGKPDHELMTDIANTVLVASMKDYPDGCSTQTTTPMSIDEYYGYVVDSKIKKSHKRINSIITREINESEQYANLTWSKTERWIKNWVWFGILSASKELVMGVDPDENGSPHCKKLRKAIDDLSVSNDGNDMDEKRCITEVEALNAVIASASEQNRLASEDESFVYVLVNKIVSGALGALSEAGQLEMQRNADERQTSCAMISSDNVRHIENSFWNDYHSSMKDLTPLWFKGWLTQLAQEKGEVVCTRVSARLALLTAPTWLKILRAQYYITDEICDLNEYKAVPEFLWMGKDLRNRLASTLSEVSAATAGMLVEAERPDPTAQVHGFLEYDTVNYPWEGRKDTMMPVIEVPASPKRYLVEHRNN